MALETGWENMTEKSEQTAGKERRKSCQPECVPGIISVRPDTSDTGETALLPELAARPLYHIRAEDSTYSLPGSSGGSAAQYEGPAFGIDFHEETGKVTIHSGWYADENGDIRPKK